jgi:kelch-like protein 7
MSVPRSLRPASVLLNDKIYICGGYSGTDYLDTVDVLDLETFRWSHAVSMSSKRICFAALVSSPTSFLVSGGSDKRFGCLSSCEQFNLEKNSWLSFPALMTPRQGHCGVRFGQQLAFLGGNDGAQVLSSCEQYDRASQSWIPFPSMTRERVYFGACVLDYRIYVVGGCSSLNSSLNSIEVFDGGIWSLLSVSLRSPRVNCLAIPFLSYLAIVGGDDQEHVVLFDPSLNAWSEFCIPTMQVDRMNFVAIAF